MRRLQKCNVKLGDISRKRAIRQLVVAGVVALTSACSGIQLYLPEADKVAVNSALREIDSYSPPVGKSYLSPSEAGEMLDRVHKKLNPAARQMCEFVGEHETCWWNVKYSSEPEFNAYATDKNLIVVYHGLLEKIGSDDELAMVLAHEMGHHIADHIDEDRAKMTAGAIIGAVAMGVLLHKSGASDCYSYECGQAVGDALESSANLGAIIGKRAFSKKQERESDMLAAYILFNAGYNLQKSRSFLLKMGAMGDRKSSIFSTHPAGPDRLAVYDEVIQTVYLDHDFMPNKKSEEPIIARHQEAWVMEEKSNTPVTGKEPNAPAVVQERVPKIHPQQTIPEPSVIAQSSNSNAIASRSQLESWGFGKFLPDSTSTRNSVTFIRQGNSRATRLTRRQGYPTADSANSDSAVNCYKSGDNYVCETRRD